MHKVKSHWIYLSLGFLIGVTYIAACGNGAPDSVAQADSDGGNDAEISQSSLVGVWNGTSMSSKEITENVQLTLNADGTYSCTTLQGSVLSHPLEICGNPVKWEISNRVLILEFTPAIPEYNGKTIIPVQFSNASTLVLLDKNGAADTGMRILKLTK